MKTYAIILAGGSGTRFNSNTPKQYLELNEIPVIIHSAITFNSIDEIDNIIVISGENYLNEVRKLFNAYKIDKLLKVLKGGTTRQESSYIAINSIDFKDDDIILIHDAARPLVSKETIINNIINVTEYGCTGTYINATDTIAVSQNKFIKEIPERKNMLIAQTPQSFKYSIIRQCHNKAKNDDFSVTDDVSLVRNYGYEVFVTLGSPKNIKITNNSDLKIAEILLNN